MMSRKKFTVSYPGEIEPEVQQRLARLKMTPQQHFESLLAFDMLLEKAHILTGPGSQIPSLGASGAISGVLGAYIALFPKQRVRVLLVRVVTEMPAVAVIGMWIVLQFVNGIGAMAQTEETGGVAYAAHVGGFIAGIALVWIFRKRQMHPARA